MTNELKSVKRIGGSAISLGTAVIPWKNEKQRLGEDNVHYGRCGNGV